MTTTEQTPADCAGPEDGFEYAIVEIFGHTRRAGRTREEERVGVKMLRIDVPIVVWRDADGGGRESATVGWKTWFYSGAAIFSFALSNEATVLSLNAPYDPPARLTYRPRDEERADPEEDEAEEEDAARTDGDGSAASDEELGF